MKYQYRCKDEHELKAILTYLFSKGYVYGYKETNNIYNIAAEYSPDWTNWKTLIINTTFNRIDANEAKIPDNITLAEIFSTKTDILKTVNVKLNKDYTAIISKDGIAVNCQTFDIKIIDELVEARNKILKS